ncbi:uncharacterized protein PV06_11640 [Exophiala oligosperma]|uniref:Uncharacterized protein n=1 Tax=Exophiala oligosperma TaxID=215243 RepID=A0A0D2D1J5_9EURO|nr:uncharacterized protein PV06_11640 [Exophiala oligosperma]KIW36060.1 hypothetical protein PV06_11640 [Exophiala oligosperma]
MQDIREIHLCPALSRIPFTTLLGELPSLMTGHDTLKHFEPHLQSILVDDFLDCEWVGLYHRNWDSLYRFDSVQSIVKVDNNRLKVSAAIIEPLNIVSNDFAMTPFGLVVFSEGVTWLWKKDWCNDRFPVVEDLGDCGHQPDLVVSQPSLLRDMLPTSIVLLYQNKVSG